MPSITYATDAKQDLMEWLAGTELPSDEYRAMLSLCKRIEMGFEHYGPLYDDKVAWNKETLEELADAMVYRAFRAIYAVKEN